MNDWEKYFSQQTVSTIGNENSAHADFASHAFASQFTPDDIRSGFIAPLTDLGLIGVSGEDAANFLHNQLTNDIEHLDQFTSRLAGYCSPKGRLLATFLIWQTGDTYFLQLPRDLLAGIQKRLHMFVMRAKVKLLEASDHYVLFGLGGKAATTVLSSEFSVLPDRPYAKSDSALGTIIRVADVFGSPRYQWITTRENANNICPSLCKVLKPTTNNAWRFLEIHTGVPQITLATQEKFVPQMINFELIGGVNFKKGCYPGQEIVARSQYLGKLKRRMLLASVESASVSPGMEVFSQNDPEQPCGMVVNAELNMTGTVDCLVELKIAEAEGSAIHLESPTGPRLSFTALPYPFTTDND